MLDFFSICEVMELVPEEEVESSAQACPNSFADGRANKVELLIFSCNPTELWIIYPILS